MLALGYLITGRSFSFDREIILVVHGAGPGWLRAAMIDITALGGGTVLTLVVCGAAVLLMTRGLRITAGLVIAASLTGSWAVDAIKGLFGRARPDIVDHIVTIGGHSFPSGHAANSAIVYLTIAALVTQVARGRALRNAIVAMAVLLVGAIGISRVYLGVHWPSDVLAGWSFGTLWALGWWVAGARTRAALTRVPSS